MSPRHEIFSAALFSLLCVGVGVTILLLARFFTKFGGKFLGTNKSKKGKLDAYECGVPQLGSARDRFGVRFYVIALMFILFDIETVFLLPYAVSYRQLGADGFYAVLAFVGVLGVGLLYLYRRGALDWE